MPRGGKREGAGRKQGSLTAKSRQVAERAAEEGITPLEFMLQVLRDDSHPLERRIDVAKAAAPYIHARLNAVEHSGSEEHPVVAEIVMRPVKSGE